jgi:hypothetical protein
LLANLRIVMKPSASKSMLSRLPLQGPLDYLLLCAPVLTKRSSPRPGAVRDATTKSTGATNAFLF